MQLLTEGASDLPGHCNAAAGESIRARYHAAKAEIHHKSVGLMGGQHDLFMIDRNFENIRSGSNGRG
jgi:hypothetical protein